MLRNIIIRVSSLFSVLFLLSACFGSGGGGGDGNQGGGTDPSATARTSVILPGDPDCAYGGILVETGIDENNNGVLDASEVDASEKICNGAPGADGVDGLNALVNISDEPAGINCASGGKRIDSGMDANANGVLDSGEIASTNYTCNGTSGSDGADGLIALIDMNPEPVGVNCPHGGVRIDVGIDTNGNTTLDPAEITQTGFVCHGTDGTIGWGVAEIISDPAAASSQPYDPVLAMNGNGNAMTVWLQSDPSWDNIWANHYIVGTGWGNPQLISNETQDTEDPRVAIDANGNAIAVWMQYDFIGNIWANRYDAGTGLWGTAQLIETDDSGWASRPQVIMDGSGNAVAVWQQYDGVRTNILANRYVVGTGWGTAELIETDNAGGVDGPQVAVDSGGNAMVVWQQNDGTRYNIWANRYDAGTGLWGTAELIETDNAGDASEPQVTIDSSGNAVVVWNQHDGTRYNIWANRYVVGTGWGTAELIETDDAGRAIGPQLAVDGNGNAMVVWQQNDGTRNNIWSNRYVVGSGWNTPQLIETDDAGNARVPHVAVDSNNGNTLAVWQQSDGTRRNIISNRYIPGLGWGSAQLVETDDADSVWDPQVAIDDSGNALAVWQSQSSGNTYIWSNRFNAQ